jgi:hypothetical protein
MRWRVTTHKGLLGYEMWEGERGGLQGGGVAIKLTDE